MFFSLPLYAYVPSYPGDGNGWEAPVYPGHHLSEMQSTLGALADVAVQREMDPDGIEAESQTAAE